MNGQHNAIPKSDTKQHFSFIGVIQWFTNACKRIPNDLIAIIGRFSIAAIFWQSGQTKVEGFVIDFISGNFQPGWPSFSDSTLELFQEEYNLPLIPHEWAALIATYAEHIFPVLLLIGLATRFSALALLIMTITIQILVYPAAYPTHGVWATVLIFLIAKGAGKFSVDHWIARHWHKSAKK